MKHFSESVIVATVATLGIITTAAWAQSGAADLEEIGWTVSPPQEPGASPDMQIRHHGGNSSFSLETGKSDLVSVSSTLGSQTSGEVTFTIDRAPGVLACQGSLTRPYDGSGKCRFTPETAFVTKLQAHGIGLTRQADLLAMTLVDVDLALIEGLKQQGLLLRTVNEIIAVAALDVTPDYVRNLKAAGLELDSFDEAIACRALGIDGPYVRGILAAGYRPSVSELIAMKATGVTPEYAKRMNAATQN